MLKLSNTLFNQQVLSLRVGGRAAIAERPIIDPNTLKIIGWWCKEVDGKRSILVPQEIRETSDNGLIIDDASMLSDPEDLARFSKVLEIDYQLLGKPVKSGKKKIGSVTDFSYDEAFIIQKLYVDQPLIKIVSASTLIVDRSQIIEVTKKHIAVVEELVGLKQKQARQLFGLSV